MVSVSTPPRMGPIAVLIAAAIAHAAVALPRSTGSGNAAAVMANPWGSISAAPTPWTARAANSSGSDGAAAHTSEAATNVNNPTRKTVRAGDAAAEVVSDCGQCEVDRVGVDESDEESQVGSDEGQRGVEAEPFRVHARTLGPE